jgi:hypothetical protein
VNRDAASPLSWRRIGIGVVVVAALAIMAGFLATRSQSPFSISTNEIATDPAAPTRVSTPPPHAAAPSHLEPSPSFRDFMRRALGPGQSLEEMCRAGSPESVRVTNHHGRAQPAMPQERWDKVLHAEPAGYTVLLIASDDGAVAHWHGIGELSGGYGFRTYGAQAVRLDGNGWRQVHQLLREPRFLRIEPFAEEVGEFAPHTEPSPLWIEHCRDGSYRQVMRIGAPDDPGTREFLHVAQSILRLGGNVYPGVRDHPRHILP